MKDKLKGKFKYVVLAVVLLIPFMYSFFYLKSYWNPYGNLSDLGVAIVNNDKTNDKSLSEDFIEGLKDSDTCKFEVVSSEKANEGLTDGDYYAIITIPENFTDNINNISEKDRQVTTITYSPNQKTNYLASQIISRIILEAEENLEGSISSAVVGSLVDSLNEVPESLNEIINATDEIKDGSESLSSGLNEINTGTNTLANKYTELDDGINSVKDGVNSLSDGTTQLVNGSENLVNGSESLVNGAETLNSGINEYTSSAESIAKIAAGYCTIDSTYYNAYLNQVSNGTINCNNINYVVQNLANGSTSLKSGSKNLVDGTKQLQTGLTTLQTGINTLQTGVNTLKDGTNTLSTGSATVKESLNTLASGTQTAYNGSITLNNGINTFKNEIVSSKEETEEKLSKLDGLDDYIEDSVEIKEEPKGEVNEYGVSFTPLFLSIGLWVGALMCYVVLYFDQEHRFKILDKENRGIKQNFAYLGLAAIFGLVTSFLLKLLLGFTTTSSISYYLSAILIAVTFMAIIQLLIRVFSDIGKFLALIILVLQLAASGGTFPVETISKGFRCLTNFLPMTYSIKLLKETLISKDSGFIFNNASILLGILIASILITTIYDLIKKNKENVEK